MRTPQRLLALRKDKQTLRVREQKISRMKKKLESLTANDGLEIEEDVSTVIKEGIDERNCEMSTLPLTDFKRLSWEQQVYL
jgi:hypothetical protein